MLFDGQLSVSDIYSMTYKELHIIKAHREKHRFGYQNMKTAESLAKNGMAGMLPPAEKMEQQKNIPNFNDPRYVPGKF